MGDCKINKFKNIIINLHTKNKSELHNLYNTKHFSKTAEAYHPGETEAKNFEFMSLQFSFGATNFRTPEKLVLEVCFSPSALGMAQMPENALPVEDYLLRMLSPAINELSESYANDKKESREKCSFEAQTASEIMTGRNGIYYSHEREKFCLKINIGIPLINNTSVNGKSAFKAVKELLETINAHIARFDENGCRRFVETFEKQQYIRRYLRENGYAAFVSDGSVLPRLNGTPAPMHSALPFKSPPELKIDILLPDGSKIGGMGIKKGITVITGGGYSGKSTLLDAIEMGIYNHIPGDGREFVITDELALKIYAEDGRPVTNLDMTPFYRYFPNNADAKKFSTHHASGSVSQAANIIEAVYAGAKLLLIDEDRSATNFMIRDKNMRVVVEKEPIIPFTERVRELAENKGVSTILVIGGSSEYLSYADTVILMEDYAARDITDFVKRLNLPETENNENEAAWTKRRSYIPPHTDRQFIYFRTVTAENQKKIILDEYSADITLLTSLVTGEQLNHLAAIMEKLIGGKDVGNTDVMDFVNGVLHGDAAWQRDFSMSFHFKAERWFENVRALDVFCTISRLRGVNFV